MLKAGTSFDDMQALTPPSFGRSTASARQEAAVLKSCFARAWLPEPAKLRTSRGWQNVQFADNRANNIQVFTGLRFICMLCVCVSMFWFQATIPVKMKIFNSLHFCESIIIAPAWSCCPSNRKISASFANWILGGSSGQKTLKCWVNHSRFG